MKHLTAAELVDALESPDQLPNQRATHLRECSRCAAQADALREALARAADDSVPEPSPLFWDHFAARVSDAVSSESISSGTPLWPAPARRRLATWAAATAAAVLVILTLAWRTTLHAPSPVGPPALVEATPAERAGSAPSVSQMPTPDNPDADGAWAVVRVAAQDLRWDEVQAAGISAPAGAAEQLALELTADERSELARLLHEELRRKGV